VEILRDYVAEKGVHSLRLCMLERRDMVYFEFVCVEEPARA
jgi:hypothetical protein